LESRDNLLDLSFAFVGCLAKNHSVVLWCEMWSQQPDGTEVEDAIGEERQDHWEPPRRARGFDPVVRGVLSEMQDLRAVREHRRRALREVEPPRIELRERGDQMRSRVAFTSGQTRHFSNQLAVGETIMNEG
jgi:hypothetical protein